MPRCPVCSRPIDLATTTTVPFCCDRCRTIDLGRWLDESYGLPAAPSDDEEGDEEDAGPPSDDEE